MAALVGKYLQKLLQTAPLFFTQAILPQLTGQLCSPCIKAPGHELVSDDRSFLQKIGGEDVLGIKNPLPHLPHLSERLLKEQAIVDNGDQASQARANKRAHCSPFFSSRCRLSASASRSSPAWTPG